MIIRVNETDYKVSFGVGFIRELDKKYYTEAKTGARFGMGLEVKMPMLLNNDIITLSEFLYEGTVAEEKRPTQKEIDAYIDSVEDIEHLFEEVVDELKKHNATKLAVKRIREELKAQKEAEAEMKKQMTKKG